MAKKRQGKFSRSSAPAKAARTGRHPIFGALKSMTFIAPGVDLTEPADPEWGKVYDEGRVSESVTRRGRSKKKGE